MTGWLSRNTVDIMGTAAPRAGTYTVMFTDQVGSTARRAELGESAADELRRIHDKIVGECLERHDGWLVKSAGDGVMAAFTAANDAVSAAVDIHQQVTAYGKSVDALAPLPLRIGLSAGDVSVEDGDLFGNPVIEAARLEAVAEPETILCAKIVQFLASGRSDAAFVDVGPLELKGLADPVDAVRIDWEPLAPARTVLPLPHRIAHAAAWPFVGRHDAFDLLAEQHKATEHGARFTFVAGEPGIGKTRLVTEFCRTLHEQDEASIVFGSCSEDLDLAYQPFIEIARQLHEAGVLDELPVSDRNQLARLLPDLGSGGVAAEGDDAARVRLFDAVGRALEIAARQRPLVVVLDDLHWGDKSSFLLARSLIANLGTSPVHVIGTYRDSEVDARHPLGQFVGDLRRVEGFSRVRLEGLGDDEAVDLARGRSLSGVLDDRTTRAVQAIRREAGGSPLYLTELFRSLAESGDIREVDGSWQLVGDLDDIRVPESVREIVDRRVHRLGEDTVRTLTTAAAVGHEFDLGLVAQLLDIDEEVVLDHLEVAVQARVIQEDAQSERFRFSHAVLRRSLYESLSVTRRGRLHQRAGELLGAGGQVKERARHAYLAVSQIEVEPTARLLLEAGQADYAALAWETAIDQYEKALEVLRPSAVRSPVLGAEIEIELGRTLRRAGDPAATAHLDRAKELARAAARPDLLAHAAIATLRPGWWFPQAGVVDHQLVADCEEALENLDDGDPMRALVLGALASALAFDPDRDRRISIIEQAEEAAGDDPLRRHAAMAHRWVGLWDPTTASERLELAERMLEAAQVTQSIEGQCQARICRLHCLLELGRAAEFRAALDDIVGSLRQASIPYFDWIVAMMRDLLAIFADDEGVDEQLVATHALGSSAQGDADVAFGAQMFALHYHRGRLADLEPFIAIQVQENPEFEVWRAAWALSLQLAGREAEARAIYDELAADQLDVPLSFVWIAAHAAFIDLAEIYGDTQAGRLVYERLEPFSGMMESAAGVMSLGPVDLFLAKAAKLTGDRETAARHARDAIAQASNFGARHALDRAVALLVDVS